MPGVQLVIELFRRMGAAQVVNQAIYIKQQQRGLLIALCVSADAISPQITELKSPLNTEPQCPFTDHPDGGGTEVAKGGRDGDSGMSETRTVSV